LIATYCTCREDAGFINCRARSVKQRHSRLVEPFNPKNANRNSLPGIKLSPFRTVDVAIHYASVRDNAEDNGMIRTIGLTPFGIIND